jgi:hypothetical protein
VAAVNSQGGGTLVLEAPGVVIKTVRNVASLDADTFGQSVYSGLRDLSAASRRLNGKPTIVVIPPMPKHDNDCALAVLTIDDLIPLLHHHRERVERP